MKTAVYARVSTNNGQDPEMQLRELREYCQRRGWEVTREYVDVGISGTKEKRPELDRLLGDAHRRNFDAVVVWRFDRFARSVSHLLRALETFRSLGIEFVSLSEQVDTSTPTGKMADTFKPSDHLTRVEVQLKGRGVLFRKIRHLHRYAAADLLKRMQFRKLRVLRDDAKPLHLLAAGRLRQLIHKFGLQGVKKRFSPSNWAYIEKTLFRTLNGKEIPDLRLRLKMGIEDWLEDRIRFPRLRNIASGKGD